MVLCCSWLFLVAPAFFCSCFTIVTGKIMSHFWTHYSISSLCCKLWKTKLNLCQKRPSRRQLHFNHQKVFFTFILFIGKSIFIVNKHSNVSVIKLSRSSHLNTSAQIEYDAFDFSSGARSLGKFIFLTNRKSSGKTFLRNHEFPEQWQKTWLGDRRQRGRQ